MPIIALTGGIAAGKSAACARFEQLGVSVIDTDKISHALTGSNAAAIPFIRATFGEEFINTQQALDRNKMRSLIFTDPEAKAQLEAILHPLIRNEVMQIAEQNMLTLNQPESLIHYQVVAVPLLFETNHYSSLVNATVVIDCSPTLQISRAMQRSQLSRESVEAILAAQVSREKRLALADYVVENNHSMNDLNVKIDALHQTLNQFCRKMQART